MDKIELTEWTSHFPFLTREDIRAMASRHGILKPIHFSDEIARRTRIGKRLLHGIVACPPHVLGIMTKAVSDRIPNSALVSIDRLRWGALYAGNIPVVHCKVARQALGAMKITVTLQVNEKPIATGVATVFLTTEFPAA